MADGGSSSAACNAAGGFDAADNSANANLGSDPGVEEESSGATLARGEPRGEDPSPGSQGQKGHKMHWQLCEVIGAVRASLNVMERCGTSTVHDRIQPTFDAYKLACEQLQTMLEHFFRRLHLLCGAEANTRRSCHPFSIMCLHKPWHKLMIELAQGGR